jgi:hypothetical protein
MLTGVLNALMRGSEFIVECGRPVVLYIKMGIFVMKL